MGLGGLIGRCRVSRWDWVRSCSVRNKQGRTFGGPLISGRFQSRPSSTSTRPITLSASPLTRRSLPSSCRRLDTLRSSLSRTVVSAQSQHPVRDGPWRPGNASTKLNREVAPNLPQPLAQSAARSQAITTTTPPWLEAGRNNNILPLIQGIESESPIALFPSRASQRWVSASRVAEVRIPIHSDGRVRGHVATQADHDGRSRQIPRWPLRASASGVGARGRVGPVAVPGTCWSSDLHPSILGILTMLQRGETDFFSGEPLRALSTLVFSDNIDLQRSASLTFAEITERGTSMTTIRPFPGGTMPATNAAEL